MKNLKNLYTWALSSQGYHAIGAFCGAVSALYLALHKAGVL